MTDFFHKIDSLLQERLSGTIPALLIDENKNIWQTLKVIKNGDYEPDKDYQKGDLGEQYVINFLTLNGYKFIKKSKKGDKTYDLLLEKNQRQMKFEVKVDFLAGITGNIAIEHMCRGEESGILKWDCDSVVYLMPNYNKIGFIKLTDLKKLVETLKQDGIGRMHTTGGDAGSNTHNYLIPISYFDDYFTIIYDE